MFLRLQVNLGLPASIFQKSSFAFRGCCSRLIFGFLVLPALSLLVKVHLPARFLAKAVFPKLIFVSFAGFLAGSFCKPSSFYSLGLLAK